MTLSSNKEENQVYFDTCASNHFVNIIPKLFDSTSKGKVGGSTSHSTPIIGRSNFKIGKIDMKASIAPGLDANLISGGKLVGNKNYVVILKKDNKNDLTIYENNSNFKMNVSVDIVATGRLDDNNMFL